MPEPLLRKGERYEIVVTEAFYQVWPSDSREGIPLAEFKTDDVGKDFAIQYFRELEAVPPAHGVADVASGTERNQNRSPAVVGPSLPLAGAGAIGSGSPSFGEETAAQMSKIPQGLLEPSEQGRPASDVPSQDTAHEAGASAESVDPVAAAPAGPAAHATAAKSASSPEAPESRATVARVPPAPTAVVSRQAPRSVAGPFVASFFIPGLGSLINGDVLNGVALLGLWLFSWVLVFFFLFGFITGLAVWIFGMVDAYLGTARWNRRHGLIP